MHVRVPDELTDVYLSGTMRDDGFDTKTRAHEMGVLNALRNR